MMGHQDTPVNGASGSSVRGCFTGSVSVLDSRRRRPAEPRGLSTELTKPRDGQHPVVKTKTAQITFLGRLRNVEVTYAIVGNHLLSPPVQHSSPYLTGSRKAPFQFRKTKTESMKSRILGSKPAVPTIRRRVHGPL